MEEPSFALLALRIKNSFVDLRFAPGLSKKISFPLAFSRKIKPFLPRGTIAPVHLFIL
jgi:hypothetical protein